MKLEGKTAVITGGSKGIGRSIAEKFAEKGAQIIIFDIEEPTENYQYHNVDVRREDQVREAIQKLDKLDILVNNAGVYRHTSLHEFDQESFKEIFQTNVKGYRMMYTYALPLLKASSDGNVVNISSGLSRRPEPYSDLYSASKAAINSMKTSWANSYTETGVRANSILPGPVETDMLTENFSQEELEDYQSAQPMKRFSQPEEVAEAAFLLVTENSMNGAEIEVGGEANSNQYSL